MLEDYNEMNGKIRQVDSAISVAIIGLVSRVEQVHQESEIYIL